MEEHVIVDSSFSAIINAPLEQIDIPSWCFSLPDDEYQGCSPAHFAAGSTTARDGRRMSINAEVIGGTPMVQHCAEQVADRHHLVLDSASDLFTQNRLCLLAQRAQNRHDFCIATRPRHTLYTTLDQHRPCKGWSLTFSLETT